MRRYVYSIVYTIQRTIPSQLTEHGDFSLPRQSAAHSSGFTAVHKFVVHLYVVYPEGAITEQLIARVLEKRKNNNKLVLCHNKQSSH